MILKADTVSKSDSFEAKGNAMTKLYQHAIEAATQQIHDLLIEHADEIKDALESAASASDSANFKFPVGARIELAPLPNGRIAVKSRVSWNIRNVAESEPASIGATADLVDMASA